MPGGSQCGQDFVVLPIGKKAVEYAHRRKLPILTEEFAEIAEISVADCFEMASLLCSAFKKGEFGHIELCFTSFVSMLSQVPEVFSMLPLTDLTDHEKSAEGKKIRNLIWYEPNEVEVFNAIVPEYLAGLIYGRCLRKRCQRAGRPPYRHGSRHQQCGGYDR